MKKKIVVLRFSAMGDVAMVSSVLREFISQNPSVELVMVSRPQFAPFFDEIPNLIFHPIAPKAQHEGLGGLFKLFKELRKYKISAVADLHDNLRSRIISTFFRLAGIKIKRIDKGRKEKTELTRTENKILRPLKLTVERYADVFRKLNYQVKLSNQLEKSAKPLPANAINIFGGDFKKIGIAPFAQHVFKVYSLQKMTAVIAELSRRDFHIYIFGGGAQEKEQAENWQNNNKNVHSLIGNFDLTEELAMISNLDLMLSMDSSGMHMASLMGIPVVSVWGPTHPYAGFLGYGQSINNCVQIDHPNRPNSIYGNKACNCGVEPCIDLIEPNTIVEKIEAVLNHG